MRRGVPCSIGLGTRLRLARRHGGAGRGDVHPIRALARTQDLARRYAEIFVVPDDLTPVHDHILDALGITIKPRAAGRQVGSGVDSAVTYASRVEHDDVRMPAFPQQSA